MKLQTQQKLNGRVKTTIELGFDSYFKASSKAIGLTKAESLGVAPILIEGKTYVPVSLFNLLFSNLNCVEVVDSVLYINSKYISFLKLIQLI